MLQLFTATMPMLTSPTLTFPSWREGNSRSGDFITWTAEPWQVILSLSFELHAQESAPSTPALQTKSIVSRMRTKQTLSCSVLAVILTGLSNLGSGDAAKALYAFGDSFVTTGNGYYTEPPYGQATVQVEPVMAAIKSTISRSYLECHPQFHPSI